MNSVMKEILGTKTPYGSGAIWWMGQMGLLVKLGETVLSVDYFASPGYGRQVEPPIPAEEVTGVHLFLGTHNHLDHIDHACWKIWAGNCPEATFVFPEAHRAEILADGIPGAQAVGLNDGGKAVIGDVTIHAIAAAHEFLAPDPANGLYPCLQYIIEGNGVRIYHAGDTLRYDGMLGKLRAFGEISAALLPINGRDGQRYRRQCIGNMTFQEAADVAGELKPRLVLPGHWDMFADNPGDPEAFADYLDAKYGNAAACRIPRIGERILMQP